MLKECTQPPRDLSRPFNVAQQVLYSRAWPHLPGWVDILEPQRLVVGGIAVCAYCYWWLRSTFLRAEEPLLRTEYSGCMSCRLYLCLFHRSGVKPIPTNGQGSRLESAPRVPLSRPKTLTTPHTRVPVLPLQLYDRINLLAPLP